MGLRQPQPTPLPQKIEVKQCPLCKEVSVIDRYQNLMKEDMCDWCSELFNKPIYLKECEK